VPETQKTDNWSQFVVNRVLYRKKMGRGTYYKGQSPFGSGPDQSARGEMREQNKGLIEGDPRKTEGAISLL